MSAAPEGKKTKWTSYCPVSLYFGGSLDENCVDGQSLFFLLDQISILYIYKL